MPGRRSASEPGQTTLGKPPIAKQKGWRWSGAHPQLRPNIRVLVRGSHTQISHELLGAPNVA